MADLFSVLSTSATALNAQQSVTSVISNNLANVDTPGYSRQTANLQSSSLDMLGGVVLGGGVTVSNVTQTRDRFVEAQLPSSQGAAAFSQAQSNSLTAVDALNASNSSGISSALAAFWTSMQSLSQDAGNASLRTGAVTATQALASSFNSTSSSLDAARSGLDTQIIGSLTQVNTLSQQIATLNTQIRGASAGAQPPNDLLDARQNAQDALVALTGAQVVRDAQGDVSLSLGTGLALVSGESAAKLSTSPDVSNGNHVAVFATLADGTGPVSVSNAAIGGQIGGWLSARDGALKTAATAIDQLAYDVARAVNTATTSSFALNGSAGQALFTIGSSAAGAAGSISVNNAIVNDESLLPTKGTSTAGAGDATGLANLINVQSQAMSGGQTAATTLATLTSQFGSETQQATANAAADQASLTHLTTLRASASGVSTNEELVNMQRAQSAYQAMSRVITTTQAMLTALMAIAP